MQNITEFLWLAAIVCIFYSNKDSSVFNKKYIICPLECHLFVITRHFKNVNDRLYLKHIYRPHGINQTKYQAAYVSPYHSSEISNNTSQFTSCVPTLRILSEIWRNATHFGKYRTVDTYAASTGF